MQSQLEDAKNNPIAKKPDMLKSSWKGYRLATDKDFDTSINTAVKQEKLNKVAKALTDVPKNFNLFSKTKKLIAIS